MNRSARYVAVCVAASCFAIVYSICDRLGLPTIWYRPLERTWSLHCGDGLAMAWYGHVLGAAIVGTVAFAITNWLARRRAGPHAVTVATAFLIASYLFAIVTALW